MLGTRIINASNANRNTLTNLLTGNNISALVYNNVNNNTVGTLTRTNVAICTKTRNDYSTYIRTLVTKALTRGNRTAYNYRNRSRSRTRRRNRSYDYRNRRRRRNRRNYNYRWQRYATDSKHSTRHDPAVGTGGGNRPMTSR